MKRIVLLALTCLGLALPIHLNASGRTTAAKDLFAASDNGDIETVKRLLTKYPDLTQKQYILRVAIRHARKNGHDDIVALLEHWDGASGAHGTLEEETTGAERDMKAAAKKIIVASSKGDIGTVRSLLAQYPDLPDRYKQLTLEVARKKGHDDIVKLLEQQGVVARKAAGGLDEEAARVAPEKKTAAPVAPKSDVDEPVKLGAARPDDFALVIGIEEYQNLPKADYGARDARTVRRYFEALGIPARNIISLEGQAATESKVKSYLEEWLPLNVTENSTLFVYYSGHGAPDPKTGQAYLVPWDGDPQFLKSTAYPLKKLYSDLAKTKAKHVIVALDACFSGAGGRSVLAKGARPLVTKVDQGVASDGRITILAAASGDQITGTLEDQGHGMFTYFFLKGLGTGKKSAKSLFDFLNPRVQDEARRQNREQTPALLGADAPF